MLLKLMMTKQLKFEDGLVALKDIEMNLIPSFFISEITRSAIEEKQMPRLYFLSWYGGFDTVKRVVEQFALKTPEEIYTFAMGLIDGMGIGLCKTHEYYPGKYTHFKVKQNPFLKYLKTADDIKEPIDYFISGSMGGGGCLVHDAVCQNIELTCQMCGDKECDFLTGTEKELKERKLWKTAVDRYELKKILPLQKEIFEGYNDPKVDRNKLVGRIFDQLDEVLCD